MMRKSRPFAGVLLLVTAFVLTACSGTSGASSKSGDLTEINVGVLPIVDVLPVYVGIKKGIFAKHGLKVTPKVAQGGAALTPSVLQGSVQISFDNAISYMIAYQKGLPVSFVANAGYSHDPNKAVDEKHPASVLLTAPGSSLTTAADLNGKTVSVNALNGIQELAVKNAIDKAGGDSSTVKFLALPLQQAQGALTSGQVDAISINEPFTSAALKAGDQIVARPFTDFDISAADYIVYMTSTKYAKSNPKVVSAFSEAIAEASDYTEAHLDQARTILLSYTKITADVADNVTLPYYDAKVNVDSLNELAEKSVKYGILDKKPDIGAMIGTAATVHGKD